MRLGLRQVRGLANADAARIVAARGETPFSSIADVWRRSGVKTGALVRIAEADGFLEPFGLARREALWAIKALKDKPLPLLAALEGMGADEPAPDLPPMSEGREVIEDYAHIGLSLRRHPLFFLRNRLMADKYHPCSDLNHARDGDFVRCAGVVLVRQRPGSAKGFRSRPCSTAPDSPSAAPTMIARIVRGRRSSVTTTPARLAFGEPIPARISLGLTFTRPRNRDRTAVASSTAKATLGSTNRGRVGAGFIGPPPAATRAN